MSDLDLRLQPESCACRAQLLPVLSSLELSAGLFLFVTTCLVASPTKVGSTSDWGALWIAPVLWLELSCPSSSEMPRVGSNPGINAGLTSAMFDWTDAPSGSPTADPSPSISGITNILAPLVVVLWLPAVRRRSVFLGALRW